MAKRTRPWFYYFANQLFRILFRLVLKAEVRGVDRVPRDGPLIIAISHSSFLDPLLAGAYIHRDIIPMAKIEAFSIPFLGGAIKAYGAFPVRRGEVDLNAFKTALQILRNGGAMVIAPEGHHSETGTLQRGREGAIMLSLRSGAPILPVAVWGGKSIWKNLPRLKRTPMWFRVGEPVIPAASMTRPTRAEMAEMGDELMVRIADMMPPELRGYYADSSHVTSHHLEKYEPERANIGLPAKQKEVIAR